MGQGVLRYGRGEKMSSAEATVDDTVLTRSTAGNWRVTRSAAVLAVIAVTQLAWLTALTYGAISLLT